MSSLVPHFVRRMAATLAAMVICAGAVPLAMAQTTLTCTPEGPSARLQGVAEASGLAVSRRVPGRLWTHNDSGQPVLTALDAQGRVTGQLRITGAEVEDWEAIAIGPCGNESCLHIADIGDNEARRRRISIYQVPEPEAADGTAAVSAVFHATYPDGAHDAETLLISDGRLYVVTKGETGPLGIYRFPDALQPGAAMRLERVGDTSPKVDADSRITDGSVSADGQWVVLRTRSALRFHRASDLFAGRWQAVSTVDVTSLNEPQGEGVAFGDGDTIYIAGEGGGRGEDGTFARLTCALPRD